MDSLLTIRWARWADGARVVLAGLLPHCRLRRGIEGFRRLNPHVPNVLVRRRNENCKSIAFSIEGNSVMDRVESTFSETLFDTPPLYLVTHGPLGSAQQQECN